jgi:hypothetical protein
MRRRLGRRVRSVWFVGRDIGWGNGHGESDRGTALGDGVGLHLAVLAWLRSDGDCYGGLGGTLGRRVNGGRQGNGRGIDDVFCRVRRRVVGSSQIGRVDD